LAPSIPLDELVPVLVDVPAPDPLLADAVPVAPSPVAVLDWPPPPFDEPRVPAPRLPAAAHDAIASPISGSETNNQIAGGTRDIEHLASWRPRKTGPRG
jgi:hypothetical protein